MNQTNSINYALLNIKPIHILCGKKLNDLKNINPYNLLLEFQFPQLFLNVQ